MDDASRDLDRLRQRTRPPAIDPAYDRTPDGGPAAALEPPECGFCRIVTVWGGGSYSVTELTWNSGWVLCAAGEGFVAQSAHDIHGSTGGEAGDEPIPFWWVRSSGRRELLIELDVVGEDEAGFVEYNISGVPGCSSIVVDREGRVIGAYDSSAVWQGLDGHDEPDAVSTVDIS